MKKIERKEVKDVVNKVKRTVFILLFILMIVLIFIVSPKITNAIQNMAKYLYELDESYITRVVELILAISLPTSILITIKKEEK